MLNFTKFALCCAIFLFPLSVSADPAPAPPPPPAPPPVQCDHGEYPVKTGTITECRSAPSCKKGQDLSFDTQTQTFKCEARVKCNVKKGEHMVYVYDPKTKKSKYECQQKCDEKTSTYYFDGVRMKCISKNN